MSWLATGGKSQIGDKLNLLHQRTIVAFPDVDGYELWKQKAGQLSSLRITVSDYLESRDRLLASERQFSQNIYERGVDDKGFGRFRSKGDAVLFGGHTTEDMKKLLGVKDNLLLADFLPTLTIAAKNLATEMTNCNVEGKNYMEKQTSPKSTRKITRLCATCLASATFAQKSYPRQKISKS